MQKRTAVFIRDLEVERGSELSAEGGVGLQ